MGCRESADLKAADGTFEKASGCPETIVRNEGGDDADPALASWNSDPYYYPAHAPASLRQAQSTPGFSFAVLSGVANLPSHLAGPKRPTARCRNAH
jgi:hypothetical protein